MPKTIARSTFVILALGFTLSVTDLSAQSRADEPSIGGSSQKSGKTRSYKKARVLQPSTAKKIVKIVEALERQKTVMVPDPLNEGQFIEKEEDDPDFVEAKEILTELLNRRDEMRSYDRSVMWNYWGYIYFSAEDYDSAMGAYENLLREPEATVPLRTASLLTLAQLNLVKENWDKGIALILQWMDEVEKVTAQSWSLLGQAYFQLGDFKKSRSSMQTAITMAEEEGYKPKENWYVIIAACIGEMKKEIEKVCEQAANKKLEEFNLLFQDHLSSLMKSLTSSNDEIGAKLKQNDDKISLLNTDVQNSIAKTKLDCANKNSATEEALFRKIESHFAENIIKIKGI